MSCFWRATAILRDYKKLKKEVAEDFIQTIKDFRKRHPYIRDITFRSKNCPIRSIGTIIMDDKFEIDVFENDIHLKE